MAATRGPRVTTRNRFGEKRGSIADRARGVAFRSARCVCGHRRDDHYIGRGVSVSRCYPGCPCTAFKSGVA